MSSFLGSLHGFSLASVFRRDGVRRTKPRSSAALGDLAQCRQALKALVAAEIIPRLLQAHSAVDRLRLPATAVPALPDAAEVDAFARLCAGDRPPKAAEIIERLKASGRTHEALYLNLIAPAARRLGEHWDEDELSFAQVTTGLMLMHQIIHGMGFEYRSGPQAAGDFKRVMLACAPGSAHLLGLLIVAEFFRSAGWQVVPEIASTVEELLRAAANEWFDLVGVSVALESQLAQLPELVAQVKAASHNPDVPVLLGGPLFNVQQHDAQRFGAIAICTDPREAVALAHALKS